MCSEMVSLGRRGVTGTLSSATYGMVSCLLVETMLRRGSARDVRRAAVPAASRPGDPREIALVTLERLAGCVARRHGLGAHGLNGRPLRSTTWVTSHRLRSMIRCRCRHRSWFSSRRHSRSSGSVRKRPSTRQFAHLQESSASRRKRIGDRMETADTVVLETIRDRLRTSSDGKPLGVAALRERIPVDGDWTHRPAQPWVVVYARHLHSCYRSCRRVG